jgi:PAS domain S-box-containing protein
MQGTGKRGSEVYMKKRDGLAQSREIYSSLVESADDPIYVVDKDCRYLSVNKKLLSSLEKPQDQVLGKTFGELHSTEETKLFIEKVNQVFETNEPVRYEFYYDRTDRWAVKTLSPIRNLDTGEVTGVGVIEKDITERKQGEENLKRKLEFEKIVSVISSRFVCSSDMDEAIDSSLADIGRWSRASRAYLFLFREDGIVMDNTHEWCAEGVSPQIENLQNLPSNACPWWMKKLRNGEIIHVEDVSKLPEAAKNEKEVLENQDIKSLLVLPLSAMNKLAGFIGFDNVMETGEWSEENLALLHVVAEIIGYALERKQTQEALRKSENKYRTIFETTGTATVIIDEDMTISLANMEFERLSGYSKEEIERKKSILEFVSFKNDLERVKGYHYQRRINPNIDPEKYELRFVDKKGDEKVILLTFSLIQEGKGTVASLLDITDQKEANETLKSTLDNMCQLAEQLKVKNAEMEAKNQELHQAYMDLENTQAMILQQEKSASIGQLSAGAAHEIKPLIDFLYRNLGGLSKDVNKLTDFIQIQDKILKSLKTAEVLAEVEAKRRHLKLDYVLENVGDLIKESLEGTDRVRKIVQGCHE